MNEDLEDIGDAPLLFNACLTMFSHIPTKGEVACIAMAWTLS